MPKPGSHTFSSLANRNPVQGGARPERSGQLLRWRERETGCGCNRLRVQSPPLQSPRLQ
jgi:hypothetical protein